MAELYKRNPNTKCAICATSIYRRPSQIRQGKGQVFCSMTCYGISTRNENPCVVCEKPILASLHKKTCSRICSNINRAGIQYKIGSPKDKVKSQQAVKIRLIQARGASCERCGYNKQKILQVHHKDRNRKNNDLNNLELICPNCHCEEHYSEKVKLKNGGVA